MGRTEIDESGLNEAGKAILSWCKAKGWSLHRLSKELGWAQHRIYRVIRADAIKADDVVAISRKTGLPFTRLADARKEAP